MYDKFKTSMGSSQRNIYSLANAVVSQAIDADPVFKAHLVTLQQEAEKTHKYNKIGCIIANQYGV
jgi:hypothetical protein